MARKLAAAETPRWRRSHDGASAHRVRDQRPVAGSPACGGRMAVVADGQAGTADTASCMARRSGAGSAAAGAWHERRSDGETDPTNYRGYTRTFSESRRSRAGLAGTRRLRGSTSVRVPLFSSNAYRALDRSRRPLAGQAVPGYGGLRPASYCAGMECGSELVEHSRETSRHRAELADYSRRLGVKPPQLRESGEVSSPMIVGVATPVLLLPEGFARFTENEVEAALCHELAHIKRRDYLMNVVCQVAALPLAWHPVVYEVQQRIRTTGRRACSDGWSRAPARSSRVRTRALTPMRSGHSRTRSDAAGWLASPSSGPGDFRGSRPRRGTSRCSMT